jgi:hypothetical protein
VARAAGSRTGPLLVRAAGVALLLSAAAAGCANLIGLDAYEEVDADEAEGGRGSGGRATGGNPPVGTGGKPPAATGGAPAAATGGRPSGPDRCDIPGFNRACLDCVASRCASECSECNANPDCIALLGCLEGCAGEQQCLPSCAEQYSNGTYEFLEVYADYACAFTTCKLECQGTLGVVGESCDADDQCEDDFCAGVNGWCTAYCDSHADCPADGYCVRNDQQTNTCFIGCITDDDCILYPGTSCEDVTLFDDGQAWVCTG